MENELLELGLSWNEVKVYQSLMKLGETAVGGIINDLKIHRQIAYNALAELGKRGMISKTMKNGVAHFKICDPEVIVENVQKQEMLAKRLSQDIKETMKKSRHEHEINIYDGREGAQRFMTHLFKQYPQNGAVYVLGVGINDYTDALGEEFISGPYTKLKSQKQIESKLIIGEALRKDNIQYEKITNPKLRETRYLPYENANPICTQIWNDRVSFMSSGSDVFIIEIINKALRNSYKEHFDMLWKIAKK